MYTSKVLSLEKNSFFKIYRKSAARAIPVGVVVIGH